MARTDDEVNHNSSNERKKSPAPRWRETCSAGRTCRIPFAQVEGDPRGTGVQRTIVTEPAKYSASRDGYRDTRSYNSLTTRVDADHIPLCRPFERLNDTRNLTYVTPTRITCAADAIRASEPFQHAIGYS